eukprot:scaffold3183_cov120-Isochrysis_galbana.AAC.7
MRDRSQAERPAAAMAKCARTSTRSTQHGPKSRYVTLCVRADLARELAPGGSCAMPSFLRYARTDHIHRPSASDGH